MRPADQGRLAKLVHLEFQEKTDKQVGEYSLSIASDASTIFFAIQARKEMLAAKVWLVLLDSLGLEGLQA